MRGWTRRVTGVPRAGEKSLSAACSVALIAGLATIASPARADEPVAAKEVRLLRETGENTTVIDAFDKDDPFDANLLLGLRQTWKSANIRRETSLSQNGLSTGGILAQNENVGAYRQA